MLNLHPGLGLWDYTGQLNKMLSFRKTNAVIQDDLEREYEVAHAKLGYGDVDT